MRIEPIKEIHPINRVSDYHMSSETGIYYLPKDKVEISDEGMLLSKNAKPTSV